jgi:hypothetical protein
MVYARATDDARLLAQDKAAGIPGTPCWFRFTRRADNSTWSPFHSEVGRRAGRAKVSTAKVFADCQQS